MVLKSPPEAVAAYTSAGLPGIPSTSVIRPPIDAGPMLRNSNRSNNAGSRVVRPPPAEGGRTTLDPALFERLEFRSIGPASMGGRITDVEGIPGNPALVYAATASGGLFKTINGGTTWTPIFDHQSTISIGDLAVDPRNSDVVSVGTGEANARNSVSFGDGVYKTLDGGKTWRNLGLQDTHHISRVVINPLNTNIA